MKDRLCIDELSYAHIAKLTPDDYELNTEGMCLRCTHVSYVVGKSLTGEYGTVFIDELSKDHNGYLVFKNITDAQMYYLGKESGLFVIQINPLKDIIKREYCFKDELKKRLNDTGLEFTFTNEQEEVKERPAIKRLTIKK